MIHLLVGNTGAGKSTYANKLKLETSGVIFTLDKWNKILFFPDKTENDGLNWFLERIERAELLMQDLILQLENSGVDSILDVGLSKHSHREKYRNFAKENNFDEALFYQYFGSFKAVEGAIFKAFFDNILSIAYLALDMCQIYI